MECGDCEVSLLLLCTLAPEPEAASETTTKETQPLSVYARTSDELTRDALCLSLSFVIIRLAALLALAKQASAFSPSGPTQSPATYRLGSPGTAGPGRPDRPPSLAWTIALDAIICGKKDCSTTSARQPGCKRSISASRSCLFASGSAASPGRRYFMRWTRALPSGARCAEAECTEA